jgi:hypothetical protein
MLIAIFARAVAMNDVGKEDGVAVAAIPGLTSPFWTINHGDRAVPRHVDFEAVQLKTVLRIHERARLAVPDLDGPRVSLRHDEWIARRACCFFRRPERNRLVSAVCHERFSRPKRSGAGLALPCVARNGATDVVERPAMLVGILRLAARTRSAQRKVKRK